MENNEVGITVVGVALIAAALITAILLFLYVKNQAESGK
jgi:hypothetical protein